jgi:hypothetical protein
MHGHEDDVDLQGSVMRTDLEPLAADKAQFVSQGLGDDDPSRRVNLDRAEQ